MSVQDVTSIVGALVSICTLAIAVAVFVTARKTHAAVNSNHQQDLARINQLTNAIVAAPGLSLPDQPGLPEPDSGIPEGDPPVPPPG